MKAQLCVRCGELIPQGCCTCGPRQELRPIPPHDLAELVVWRTHPAGLLYLRPPAGTETYPSTRPC